MNSKLKRGCLVNIIFILSILGSIINILSFFTNKFVANLDPSLKVSTMSMSISTAIGIVTLGILIGAWLWNEICIYAIIPVNLVSIAYNLSSTGVTTPSIIGSIINILINCFFVYSLLKISKLNKVESV